MNISPFTKGAIWNIYNSYQIFQLENLFTNQYYKYSYKKTLEVGGVLTKPDSTYNNTARIILYDKNSNIKSIVKMKILLYSTTNYSNINGMLEANATVAYPNYNSGKFMHKKVDILSDTKQIKCFNIDFEVVDNEYVALVVRYNANFININLRILTDDNIIASLKHYYEDISQIQEWY